MLDAPDTARTNNFVTGYSHDASPISPLPNKGEEDVSINSVQLPFRDRRLEGGDLGGVRRLAVEGQHVALARDHDAVAVGNLAGEDHLGKRILAMALDHPLQRARAIGGVPALG